MTLRDVRGQAPAIDTLTRAIAAGKVHHAYRFEGPEGVGKEAAAFGLAQALVCTGGDPLGCGSCRDCQQAVELRDGVPLHPDVVVVERGLYSAETLGAKGDEKSWITIAQIRKVVLAQLAFTPHRARARVFIIKAADELKPEAANALLKTLEEPPRGTHFILVTARPSKLLTTIRSRSLPVRFGPLADDVVADILRARGVSDERVRDVVPLAGGSVGAALELADEAARAARKAFIDAALGAVRSPSMALGVELAEGATKDRQALRIEVEALAAHFVVRARAAVEAGATANADRLAAAHDLAMKAAGYLDSAQNASTNLTILELVTDLRGSRAP
jgi:DNA polymerase-3 subunit delta'